MTAISYDRVVSRTSIKLLTRYRLVTLWEGDLSHLRYTSDHWVMWNGSPLTLGNHFIQPYRSVRYSLLRILLTVATTYYKRK